VKNLIVIGHPNKDSFCYNGIMKTIKRELGWKLGRWRKTKQFWSVPFVSDEKRRKYLQRVKKDVRKDLKFEI
jgi:putative NADPH-quinone reductase